MKPIEVFLHFEFISETKLPKRYRTGLMKTILTLFFGLVSVKALARSPDHAERDLSDLTRVELMAKARADYSTLKTRFENASTQPKILGEVPKGKREKLDQIMTTLFSAPWILKAQFEVKGIVYQHVTLNSDSFSERQFIETTESKSMLAKIDGYYCFAEVHALNIGDNPTGSARCYDGKRATPFYWAISLPSTDRSIKSNDFF